jgi:hypothetical protein
MLGQSLLGNRARHLAHRGSNDGAEPHANEMTQGFILNPTVSERYWTLVLCCCRHCNIAGPAVSRKASLMIPPVPLADIGVEPQ